MRNRRLEVRLAWLSLALALATLAALVPIDMHLRNGLALLGIVSFEVCAYSGVCRAIVDAWGPVGRIWAGLSLGLDYLFMLLYSAVIFLALRLAGDPLPDKARRVTQWLAWAAWGAGAADAIENYALAQMLVAPDTLSQAWTAALAATVKFAVLGVALTWLVMVWAYRCAARMRS